MTNFSSQTKRRLAILAMLLMALLVTGFGRTEATQKLFRQNSAEAGSNDYSTGKTPATPGEQPWMVALVGSDSRNAHDGQFCGASLIADEWVLTAAHCLEENGAADEVDVVIGRHVLSDNDGERITAEAIYLHEGYFDYDDNEDNDIALIKLSQPATVGRPINVVTAATEYTDDPGTLARATGWGVLSENAETSPDVLHGVNIPIVTQTVCQAEYGSDLLPDGLCAGVAKGGLDTCYGDSGGPLVSEDRNGEPTQVGVVSWGDECGAPGSYGVYARLTDYETWIRDVRNGDIEPTDMSELGGWGDSDWDDADWGDDGDWDDSDWDDSDWDEDDSDWADWEDDDDSYFSDEAIVDVDSAEMPAGYELIYDDTFYGEQETLWENNRGDFADLYATEGDYDSIDEWIDEVGGTDGVYKMINGTRVLFEQLEDDDGGMMEVAAYLIDGAVVEIYSSMSANQLNKMVTSLLK